MFYSFYCRLRNFSRPNPFLFWSFIGFIVFSIFLLSVQSALAVNYPDKEHHETYGTSPIGNPLVLYHMDGDFPAIEKDDDAISSGSYELNELSSLYNVEGFNGVSNGAYELTGTTGWGVEIEYPDNNTNLLNGYYFTDSSYDNWHRPRRNSVVSFWFKFDDPIDNTTGKWLYWKLPDSFCGQEGLYKLQGNNYSYIWDEFNYDTNTCHTRNSSFTMTDINDDSWHHILIRNLYYPDTNNTDYSVFIDGVKEFSTNSTRVYHVLGNSTGNDFRLGYINNSSQSFTFDEFFYGTGFPTDADVLEYYNASPSASPSATLSVDTAAPWDTQQDIYLNLEWENQTFDVNKIWLFPDHLGIENTLVASGSSLGSSGSGSFLLDFSSSGSYIPLALLGESDCIDFDDATCATTTAQLSFEMYVPDPPPSAVLSLTSSSPYLLNEYYDFSVTHSNLGFEPMYIHLYNDVEETGYITHFNYGGFASPYLFSLDFDYSANYKPYVIFSDCGDDHRVNASCNNYESNYVDISIVDSVPISTVFESDIRTVALSGSVLFNYDVDDDVCTSGSGFNLSLFSGLPLVEQSLIDLGSSGSGSYSYQYLSRGSNGTITPYLVIECLNAPEYHTIYLNSALDAPWSAGTIYIESGEELDYIPPVSDFINGNELIEDVTASGSRIYSFSANRLQVPIDYKIILRYLTNFNDGTIIDEIEFYSDVGQPAQVLTESIDNDWHYMEISYSTSGRKTPYLLVKFDTFDINDPSSYLVIYLGGSSNPSLANEIVVQEYSEGVYVDLPSASDYGIFGFPIETFLLDFDAAKSSTFLSAIQGIVNVPIRVGVFLGSVLFKAVSHLPIISSFETMINPPDGLILQMPSSFDGLPINKEVFGISSGDSVVIDRPPLANFKQIDLLVRLAVMIGFVYYVIKKLILLN